MRLWHKITLAGLLLLGAVLSVVYLATSRLMAASITGQLQARGNELARPLSAALLTPLRQQDFATVQSVLDDVTASGHLRSMRLLDPQGRVIAYSGGLVLPDEPTQLAIPYADTEGGLWMNFKLGLQSGGQPEGELRYALSAQALTDSLAHLRQQLLQISVLAVLGFGALVVWGSRWLTRPLRRLTAAAQRMQSGEYEVFLPSGRSDEIGQLSTSLAALRDAIRDRIAQLGSARETAEAASRAKSAFLANTSHELRTPLNGLLGMARLARQTDLDPALRKQYLDLVVDSAQSLADILSDTLDLARIEAGKLLLHSAPFEPRPMLQSVLSAYQLLADGAGLALALQVDEAVPAVLDGDALRLRQILSNYLGNAIKFTPSGQIRVRLQAPAAGCLRLSVQDQGVGIPPAVAARLFQPFTQADDSTTRRHGGTGLGLAICKELAQRMGGDVGVDSAAGQGSTFWATLQMPAGTLPARRPPVPAADLARLQGARVLMVDDNPVNRILAVALLQRWGMRVDEAEDGAQAVAAVRAADTAGQPFAVVLMDLQMPVLDGYAATRALRHQYSAAQLPIIALTAAALLAERELALDAGMNDFLTKPLDAPHLQGLLCRLLHQVGQDSHISG